MDLRAIQLFLFDIDGVLLAGKREPRLLSGRRILPELRRRGLPYLLITNTSTHSAEHLAASLQGHGLEVSAAEIHSALGATVRAAARRYPGGRCFVVGEDGMHRAVLEAGLRPVQGPPADLVMVGLTRYGDYRLLSLAARCIGEGAALLGCHRNRLWLDDDGLALSCGSWLAALEYATGAQAEVFGKPTAAFYDEARERVAVAAENTLMVGDDLESDMAGAQRAGIRGALVLTGKTGRDAMGGSAVEPDLVLDQADDLADLLFS